VLDIAFAAQTGGKVSFASVTKVLIDALGERLAAWVDHHDHEKHVDYAQDERFVLCKKSEHGACPEILTPALVRSLGPVDTIVAHFDLDGLYSAAKWMLNGVQPYAGADDDARCVDTRLGQPGPIGVKVDRALRARFRDDDLKRAVVLWLVGGCRDDVHKERIDEAEREFDAGNRGTAALACRFEIRGKIAFVDASEAALPYDKTELLLLGQKISEVAAVQDSGAVTIAAGFDSGWDFLKILGLAGGMPTRVSIAASRIDEVFASINAAKKSE